MQRKVYGDAKVHERASVAGDARIFGNAEVLGKAVVEGDSEISEGEVSNKYTIGLD